MASTKTFKDLKPYFLYVLLTATIGPLLFGYHLAELNTPQDVITCKRKSLSASDLSTGTSSIPQCIPMNPAEIGLISSIFTLGGLIGALTAGPYASKHGRKRATQLSTLPFAVGPIFEALAPNISIMAIGRFISGLGAGAAIVVIPIFIAEVSPPEQKGFFGAFTQVMVNVGILLTQLLGYFLSYGQMWRIVLAIGGALGVAQFVGLLASVESPRWLVDQGRSREANTVLKKLRGHSCDTEGEVEGWGTNEGSEDIHDEEETLLAGDDQAPEREGSQHTRKTARKNALGMFEAIRHPHTQKATFVVVMIMVAQQFTGINSIIMYGVSLLADLLQSNSAILNLLVSALNIVMTVAAAPLIDKLGRRICLLTSTAGMGVGALLLGIGILHSISVLSAIAVLIFVASYAVGLGPVPFILASELVGAEAVGAAQAWSLAANWTATFIVAQFFPVINAALGKGKIYFVFAGIAACFWIFIASFLPETKEIRARKAPMKCGAGKVRGKTEDDKNDDTNDTP